MSDQALVERKDEWIPANFDNGDIFVRKTPTGIVKQVKAKIQLFEKKGQIADLGKSGWMITNEGYIACNKIAGLTMYTPQTMQVEGRTVPNPYCIIDHESGSVEKVWVRKVVVGFSPMGNLVVTVSTLLYDLKMYLIEDIAKKIQYNKDIGRLCTKASLTEDELLNGFFLPYQGELGIYAKWDHDDIRKVMNTFIGSKKNAERKAQSICERNAYRKHPTIPPMKIEAPTHGIHEEIVFGFSHQLTREELQDIAEQASKEGGIDNGEVIEEEITDLSEEDLNSEHDEDSVLNNEGGTKF